MTFIPGINGKVSTVNSTTSTLGAAGTFTGTGEDVSKCKSIEVSAVSNVSSGSLGVSLEFSTDNTNWDNKLKFTYSVDNTLSFNKTVNVQAQYFRIVYTTVLSQTFFRLQCLFHVSAKSGDVVALTPSLIDKFGRLRTSRPHTLIELDHVGGKRVDKEFELVTGSATSTADTNASAIVLATTGTGSVELSSRRRGYCQPGKSLLWLITGVLNNGTNASTVTTRLGCFDDDNGFFFQNINGVTSVVKRSSVTGSIVDTVVNQSDWNISKMDGTENVALDFTKTLIFYTNLGWLGVGVVVIGVVLNGISYDVHKFRHSNLETLPYLTSASLPLRWEIKSTGGAGSLLAICGTIVSEGGSAPVGKIFSANMGDNTKSVDNEESLIAIRLKSGAPKNQALIQYFSIVSEEKEAGLIRIWKFRDTAATSILTGSSFVSANADSAVEYDVSTTSINTSGGTLLFSGYFADKIAQFNLDPIFDMFITMSNGISELLVLSAETVNNSKAYVASMTWSELN
jgi:hypothetical protein